MRTNQPQTLQDQIRDLQRQINDLRSKVGINSAVVPSGLSIRTSVDGPRVEILSGAIEIVGDSAEAGAPHITITADDESTTAARIWAGALGDGTQLDISIRNVVDDTIDGGKLLMWRDGTILSHQPAGAEEMLIGLGWPTPGVITFRGKFADYTGADSTDALFTGSVPIGGAASGVTLTYGPTMASAMAPIAEVFDNPATPYGHLVTASSTTGFTVGFATTSNGAFEINFWCFRQ